MKIKLDEGAFPLTREHPTDAGLDIRAKAGKTIEAYGSEVFRTGVHIQLPRNTCGLIISRSGMNVKNDVESSIGLIDEGYTGELMVKLRNHSVKDYKVKKGDKISQLIVIPACYVPIEIVEELEETERGENGIGSTGR